MANKERRYYGNVGQMRKHTEGEDARGSYDMNKLHRGTDHVEHIRANPRGREARVDNSRGGINVRYERERTPEEPPATVRGVVSSVVGAARGAVDRVGEIVEERREKKRYEEREGRRDKYRTRADYVMESRLNRLMEEDDGTEESNKKIEALLDKMKDREGELDDTAFATERIKARDKVLLEQELAEKREQEERSQTPGDAFFGAPSDMFGVGSYGGGSDMFGVGGYGGGGMDMSMFAVGSPSLGNEQAPRSPKRTRGRVPARSQPAGYDGYYDPFGMGSMGNAGGSDMFAVSRPSEPRRGKKGRHHAVGNPLAPADLFAPANVFGIGGGRASARPIDPFGMGGLGKAPSNPFASRGGSKRVSNPFGGGGFGGFGGAPANPFAAPARRKTKRRR